MKNLDIDPKVVEQEMAQAIDIPNGWLPEGSRSKKTETRNAASMIAQANEKKRKRAIQEKKLQQEAQRITRLGDYQYQIQNGAESIDCGTVDENLVYQAHLLCFADFVRLGILRTLDPFDTELDQC